MQRRPQQEGAEDAPPYIEGGEAAKRLWDAQHEVPEPMREKRRTMGALYVRGSERDGLWYFAEKNGTARVLEAPKPQGHIDTARGGRTQPCQGGVASTVVQDAERHMRARD